MGQTRKQIITWVKCTMGRVNDLCTKVSSWVDTNTTYAYTTDGSEIVITDSKGNVTRIDVCELVKNCPIPTGDPVLLWLDVDYSTVCQDDFDLTLQVGITNGTPIDVSDTVEIVLSDNDDATVYDTAGGNYGSNISTYSTTAAAGEEFKTHATGTLSNGSALNFDKRAWAEAFATPKKNALAVELKIAVSGNIGGIDTTNDASSVIPAIKCGGQPEEVLDVTKNAAGQVFYTSPTAPTTIVRHTFVDTANNLSYEESITADASTFTSLFYDDTDSKLYVSRAADSNIYSLSDADFVLNGGAGTLILEAAPTQKHFIAQSNTRLNGKPEIWGGAENVIFLENPTTKATVVSSKSLVLLSYNGATWDEVDMLPQFMQQLGQTVLLPTYTGTIQNIWRVVEGTNGQIFIYGNDTNSRAFIAMGTENGTGRYTAEGRGWNFTFIVRPDNAAISLDGLGNTGQVGYSSLLSIKILEDNADGYPNFIIGDVANNRVRLLKRTEGATYSPTTFDAQNWNITTPSWGYFTTTAVAPLLPLDTSIATVWETTDTSYVDLSDGTKSDIYEGTISDLKELF